MHNRTSLAMAGLCAMVALLAGVAAGFGVFARGDGSYETVTSVRGITYVMATTGVYAYNAQRVVAEGIGWDIATLFLVAPAMLITVPFVARGSFHGRLVALGLLGYFFYQYLEYAVTWAFGALFPLFVLTYAVSLIGIVWLAVSVGRDGVGHRFTERYPRRAYALLTGGMALLLSLLWARRIATGLAGDLEGASLWGETTMVVPALDLGLVVPAALLAAALVWRRSPAGYALGAVWIVTSTGMASAIAAMLISAGVIEGAFELGPLAIFGLYFVAAAMLAVAIHTRGLLPDTAAGDASRSWTSGRGASVERAS